MDVFYLLFLNRLNFICLCFSFLYLKGGNAVRDYFLPFCIHLVLCDCDYISFCPEVMIAAFNCRENIAFIL